MDGISLPSNHHAPSALPQSAHSRLSDDPGKRITPSDEIPCDTPLYASLDAKGITDEARALVTSIRKGIEFHEGKTGSRKNKRCGYKLEQFEFALGAFLADLMRAASHEEASGWVFRSMKAGTFTDESVSHRTFMRIVGALSEVQLITKVAGYQRWASAGFQEGDNAHFVTEAKAARFKASKRLLEAAMHKGITPDNAHLHFIQALPKHPIVLRSASRQERGNKVAGRSMKLLRTPEVERLETDVKRLNTFLDGFTLLGGTHRGYHRIFNLGDRPDFAWNKGGRLYSQGDESYQRLKEAERVLMTINGDPVVEIDISASYLTILHEWLGKPFDASRNDPYAVDGLKPLADGRDLRRSVAKSWTIATLGHDKHHTRWPGKVIMDFRNKTGLTLGKVYPINTVREAMERRHPILKDWGTLGLSWADLMFIESQTVLNTMLELMDAHQAPSFSVHDSLIVREKDLEIVVECLMRHYKTISGIEPALEVTFNDDTIEKRPSSAIRQ